MTPGTAPWTTRVTPVMTPSRLGWDRIFIGASGVVPESSQSSPESPELSRKSVESYSESSALEYSPRAGVVDEYDHRISAGISRLHMYIDWSRQL